MAFIWPRLKPVMSVPLNQTEPPVGSSSLTRVRPVVVLPQPDSPTRPRVSPAESVKLTPSTAYTVPTCLRVTPPRIGKCVLRSEEHTSELQSRHYLVCRLLLEKKNT